MKKPTTDMLLRAYSQGIFPMANEDEEWELYWYAPDPRAILPIDDEFHVSRSLRRTIRKETFEIRYDTCFRRVMEECAAPRGEHWTGTWISPYLMDAYTQLHELGFAHSIEAWQDDELVGGLYGVSLGGLFAGESMYHDVTDASKVCLVKTVERLRERDFDIFDIQFMTDHLARFGAKEISRDEYEERVVQTAARDVEFD